VSWKHLRTNHLHFVRSNYAFRAEQVVEMHWFDSQLYAEAHRMFDAQLASFPDWAERLQTYRTAQAAYCERLTQAQTEYIAERERQNTPMWAARMIPYVVLGLVLASFVVIACVVRAGLAPSAEAEPRWRSSRYARP
jgi:hypothetical protein